MRLIYADNRILQIFKQNKYFSMKQRQAAQESKLCCRSRFRVEENGVRSYLLSPSWTKTKTWLGTNSVLK